MNADTNQLHVISVLISRDVVTADPHTLGMFANMYLAGTIIFDEGPLIIPLLGEYIVP
jgi:hypothetical protein